MKKAHLIIALLAAICSFPLLAGPVNINTADAETLARELNGVGISKAALIVAYRDSHGAFKTADDLAKVKGIGKATIEKNRDNILLGSKKEATKKK
ncbi:MAG: helix-hairpin-helix domain-containing protein [Proteobacteria bacterium]|nr:helix-hairpin-helix domain-containing protein [Pseudomonadota bacterium]